MKTAKEVYIECLKDYLGDDFNGEELTEWSLFEKAMEEYADQFKPKWISVETPPKELGNYWVTNGRAMLVCGLLGDGTFHGIVGATHYMALPSMP